MTDYSGKIDSSIGSAESEASLPEAPLAQAASQAQERSASSAIPDEAAPQEQTLAAPEATVGAEESSPEEIPEQKSSSHEPSHESGFWGMLQSLAVTIIIALFIITFVVQAFQIPSPSMENTLLVGDYLLVDKAKYGHAGEWSWLLPYREIQRGDVIVFRYPVDPEKHFVKRVVAIPGDHVRLRAGRLYLNGTPQDEPFAVHKVPFPDDYRDEFPNGRSFRSDVQPAWSHEMPKLLEDGDLIIPPDCFFVLGDNRDNSLDSRYWGFVPRENIVGRPLVIYFSHVVSSEPPATDLSDKLARLTSILGHFAGSVRWNRTLRIIR